LASDFKTCIGLKNSIVNEVAFCGSTPESVGTNTLDGEIKSISGKL